MNPAKKSIEAIQNMSTLTNEDLMRTLMKSSYGEQHTLKKGKDAPGIRDGSGPYKGSFQDKTYGKGKRKQAGNPCPMGSKLAVKPTKKLGKSATQEANDILKNILARAGAKVARLAHRGITGAGKGIVSMADRGIGRNMARTGAVGNAAQRRMGNVGAIGSKLASVTPKQVRGGVRSAIKNAPVAAAIGGGAVGLHHAKKAIRRRLYGDDNS